MRILLLLLLTLFAFPVFDNDDENFAIVVSAFMWDVPPPYTSPPAPLSPEGLILMCELRDKASDLFFDDFAQALQLDDLFKNYYCDGGCYMCCWSPATNGGCHSSYDYQYGWIPPINCDPGLYGSGTTILGEALIVGDVYGLGICIGGVIQLCTHFPSCNADGGSPGGGATSRRLMHDRNLIGNGYEPPTLPANPDMVGTAAQGSRLKALVKMLFRNLYFVIQERPAHLPRQPYIDMLLARGMPQWIDRQVLVAPFNGTIDIPEFAVYDDTTGNLMVDYSYRKGYTYHLQLSILGAIPNVIHRLNYVESRFWTTDEIDSYLSGVDDPDVELCKSMKPIALEAVKRLPIRDYRLLSVPAPNETTIANTTSTIGYYEGFFLGMAPVVTVVEDNCSGSTTVIAVLVEDDDSTTGVTSDEVVVHWGDGDISRALYDANAANNTYTHDYEMAGDYPIIVYARSECGLMGIGSVLIHTVGGATTTTTAATIVSLELEDFLAFGPALITAGTLSMEMIAEYVDGTTTTIGYTPTVNLGNTGSTDMGRLVANNEMLKPMSALILRPTNVGRYYYDSVYFQTPSLRLGFQDYQIGEVVYVSTPVLAYTMEVWYLNATAPVSASLIETDIYGNLIFPIVRTIPNLPVGHCSPITCLVVDRIRIPITSSMLSLEPSRGMKPPGMSVGDSARWVEIRPAHYETVQDVIPVPTVNGQCTTTITPTLVVVNDDSVIVSLVPNATIVQVNDATIGYVMIQATTIDGTILDVTDRMTWSSSDPQRVTVSNEYGDKGRIWSSTLPGQASVTAILGAGDNDVGKAVTINVDNVSPSRGYPVYRFLFTRVHGGWSYTSINALQPIIDGVVAELSMTSTTVGQIGNFNANISSSHGNAVGAFDANFGLGWASDHGTFNANSPYDVAHTCDPVYLQINFDEPIPLDGFLMYRNNGINPASYYNQYPAEAVVLGSLDGISFKTIATHTVVDWGLRGYPIEEVTWSIINPTLTNTDSTFNITDQTCNPTFTPTLAPT